MRARWCGWPWTTGARAGCWRGCASPPPRKLPPSRLRWRGGRGPLPARLQGVEPARRCHRWEPRRPCRHSSNGVVLLGKEDIEWCNLMAGEHLGFAQARSGPAHPQPGPRSGLHRLSQPARLQPAGGDRRPSPPRSSAAHRDPDLPLRQGAACAHARRHHDRTGRGDAARFRGQCLARDPQPADGDRRLYQTLQTTCPALQEAERAHFLELMRQQAQRMQTLVDDLLTTCRGGGDPVPTIRNGWQPPVC